MVYKLYVYDLADVCTEYTFTSLQNAERAYYALQHSDEVLYCALWQQCQSKRLKHSLRDEECA